MKPLVRHAALLAALTVALPATSVGADNTPQAAPAQIAVVDTLTPRLDQLAAQIAATLQRMESMQVEIRNLTNTVTAHGKSIGGLTTRAGNAEVALGMTQKNLEEDAQAIRANTDRLVKLQAGLTAAQQDIVTLRAQLAQVEGALVKHGAWIAKQTVASNAASTTASEALQRAMAAGKLAEGKLVYESVLSEEMTQFQPYKWDLSDSAKDAIKAFAEKLKDENSNVYLEIQGHTDTSGSKQLNQNLSKLRAEAVRDFLNKECGILLHRMEAVAYGDSKPIADNSTKEGRSQNRRVTVVVLQ